MISQRDGDCGAGAEIKFDVKVGHKQFKLLGFALLNPTCSTGKSRVSGYDRGGETLVPVARIVTSGLPGR